MSGTDPERVEVEPALTAEQWASGDVDLQSDGPDGLSAALNGRQMHLWVTNANGYQNTHEALTPADCKALAALALQVAGPDGGPLFTLEHLLALRSALDIWEFEESGQPGAEWHVLRGLGDALASILPPEPGPSDAEA